MSLGGVPYAVLGESVYVSSSRRPSYKICFGRGTNLNLTISFTVAVPVKPYIRRVSPRFGLFAAIDVIATPTAQHGGRAIARATRSVQIRSSQLKEPCVGIVGIIGIIGSVGSVSPARSVCLLLTTGARASLLPQPCTLCADGRGDAILNRAGIPARHLCHNRRDEPRQRLARFRVVAELKVRQVDHAARNLSQLINPIVGEAEHVREA